MGAPGSRMEAGQVRVKGWGHNLERDTQDQDSAVTRPLSSEMPLVIEGS